MFERWLTENIQKSKLSNILSFVLSDTEHLRNCYDQSAFIRSEEYQNALMLCVYTLETNQKRYLDKIDTSLLKKNIQVERKTHRRSISQPTIVISPMPRKSILSHMKKSSRTFDVISRCCEKVKVISKWKSMPNLYNETHNNRPRSKTVCLHQKYRLSKKVSFKQVIAKEAEEDVPYFEYKDSMTAIAKSAKNDCNANHNVPIHLVNVDDIKIHTDYRYSSDFKSSSTSSSSSFTPKKTSLFSLFESPLVASKASEPEVSLSTSPTDFFLKQTVVAGEKLRTKSALLSSTLNPEKDESKKRKSSKQNLAQFIQNINSARPKVELDRENAHFHLSEAIIATCTQLKWKRVYDEKYKIPKDCRIKQSLHHSPSNRVQPPSKICHNPLKFTIGSADDDTNSSLSSEEVSFSENLRRGSEDIHAPHMEWNSTIDINSPESIAMSLMSRFKNEKFPSANSLLWLVSESQAPQSLLPLPDSFPINPDENFNFNAIRGQQYWAPPRGQVIFTVHPPPDRKRQLILQGNRCAGCGMKVSAAYTHKFRYCDYTSKYFCSACHKLQVSTIPARVLEKWDFTLNSVSNFAYKWLDQIWNLPLFHVSDLNPKLYSKVKQLSAAREARLQLKYVLEFIKQCRFAENEQETIKKIPIHWIEDVDIWSMLDFMNVKDGTFTARVQEVIKSCEDHIIKNSCEVRKFINSLSLILNLFIFSSVQLVVLFVNCVLTNVILSIHGCQKLKDVLHAVPVIMRNALFLSVANVKD